MSKNREGLLPEKPKPLNIANFEKDNIILRLSWSRVNKVIRSGYGAPALQLTDLDLGYNYTLNGKELVNSCLSADYMADTVECTKTQLAEVLVASRNVPFTVVFKKQDGSLRSLRGRLVSPEPLLGRSHVEDLDIDADKYRLRLVDHRTIESICVGSKSYVLKGKK